VAKTKKKQPEKIALLDLSKVEHSLTEFPWPYADGTVEEVNCIHKIEYVPGKLRARFMEELWRIMTVGAKLTVIACYWTSPRAIQDPELEWPPISEQSFLYFNKGWREANNLPAIKADFDFSYGYQIDGETAAKNTETQAFWIKHYTNAVNDLQLALVKRAVE